MRHNSVWCSLYWFWTISINRLLLSYYWNLTLRPSAESVRDEFDDCEISALFIEEFFNIPFGWLTDPWDDKDNLGCWMESEDWLLIVSWLGLTCWDSLSCLTTRTLMDLNCRTDFLRDDSTCRTELLRCCYLWAAFDISMAERISWGVEAWE